MNSTIRYAIRLTAFFSLFLLAPHAWAQGQPDFIPPPIDPTKDSPAWPGPGKARKATPRAPTQNKPAKKKAAQKKAAAKPSQKKPAKPAAAPQTGAKQAPRLEAGWSTRDTKDAVASLVARLLRAPWLADFSKKHGRPPSIFVGRIGKRSGLIVDTRKLERAITAALARSTRITVAKPKGTGVLCPDLMLAGTLFASIHKAADLEQRDFRLFLSLTRIVSAERSWIDDFSRRKLLRKAGGKTIVTLLAPKQRRDLSGEITDAHIQDTARAAIKHLLTRPMAAHLPRHALRVYPPRNHTPEHISRSLIRDTLEREIHHSGLFDLLIPLEYAPALRALRARIVRQKSATCPVAMRHESPARFVISSRVMLRTEALADSITKLYLLSFQAIDVTNDRKGWLHTRRIKMVVKKKKKNEKKKTPSP